MKKLLQGGTGQLINYDYFDIADGTGVVNFYLGTTFENATSGAQLGSNTWYSNTVGSARLAFVLTSGAFQKLQDIDFDLDLNTPRIIQGDALLNITTAIDITSMPATEVEWIFLNARLRKWDGTTETEIVQTSGAQYVKNSGDTAVTYYTQAIKIPIPRTHFKAGETLRLTLEHHATANKDNGGDNQLCLAFGHDPMNRAVTLGSMVFNGTTVPTIATIKIPFKLDI
jgi:hypothetical protein